MTGTPALRLVDEPTERASRPNTLDPLIARYLRERRFELAELTIAQWRPMLRRFSRAFGSRSVRSLDASYVRGWLSDESERCAASTIRQYFVIVRLFLRWCAEQGVIPRDPTLGMRSPRLPRSVPRALAWDEVGRILAACRNERDRVCVWLMVGLGLRRVEVCRLEHADIDWHRGLVHVVGKGSHERVLPLIPEVRAALDAYVRAYPASSGPLVRRFVGGSFGCRLAGQPLQPNSLTMAMRRLMRDAGVKAPTGWDGRASCHAFRHTAASDVADRTSDLRIVQAMLGHSSISTTTVYLRRARLDDMAEAMTGRNYAPDAPEVVS